jgi:hypothetical protein
MRLSEKHIHKQIQEKRAMKARVNVKPYHWAIVEQVEGLAKQYLLAEEEYFTLFGLPNEPHEFRIIRIKPNEVDIQLTGSYLVLVNEGKTIGDGQSRTELKLKVGECCKLATPTIDAGMVWDICLEEIC